MRAQGALEYLIIIAAVLGISAIVVFFVTGAFTSSTSGADFSKCRVATANCKHNTALGVTTVCDACKSACTDSRGMPLIGGAVTCCKQGLAEKIYSGSTECSSPRELFYDEFADMNAWSGDLSPFWYANTTFGFNNSNSAYKQSYATRYILHTQDTTDYYYIALSFWSTPRLRDCSAGMWVSREFMLVEWSPDGSAWNRIYDDCNSAGWAFHSYPIPAAASNNPNFAVRVGCYDSHNPPLPSEYCAIDTFRIIGIPE